jgi:2-methylcitrate dehydratase PrpD
MGAVTRTEVRPVTSAAAGETLSARIAAFVAATDAACIPANVMLALRCAALDGIASILSGVPEPVSRHVLDMVTGYDRGDQATIIGFGGRASLAGAALVNGTLAHACDYDDSSWTMWGHPTAPVLPAALAVCEHRGVSGAAMLTALGVGIEVAKALGIAMQPRHYKMGWHPTGTLGIFGAAAAAARALELSAEQAQMALGIAASASAGLRVNSGSMTKPLHVGFAARGGMEAALLARAGTTASPHALDGRGGFIDLYSPRDPVTPDAVAATAASLGNPYDVVSPGLSPKIYPCCSDIHAAIDATLDLCAEHGLVANRVRAVRCGVSSLAITNISRPILASVLDAKFSMQYCLAVTLTDGPPALRHFTAEALAAPNVRALMRRIEVTAHPDLAGAAGEAFSTPAIVEIETVDGRRLIKSVRAMRGHPERPVPYARLVEKFRECAEPILGANRTREAAALIDDLPALPDISPLLRSLVPSA